MFIVRRIEFIDSGIQHFLIISSIHYVSYYLTKCRDTCVEAPSDALVRCGQLMTESHTSCSTLYQCSSPGLDTITSLALQFGALGARLTGEKNNNSLNKEQNVNDQVLDGEDVWWLWSRRTR